MENEELKKKMNMDFMKRMLKLDILLTSNLLAFILVIILLISNWYKDSNYDQIEEYQKKLLLQNTLTAAFNNQLEIDIKNIAQSDSINRSIIAHFCDSIQRKSKNKTNSIIYIYYDTLRTKTIEAKLKQMEYKCNTAEIKQLESFNERINFLNHNVTIWICVLGSICTIIPVVLSLAASYNVSKEYDKLVSKFDVLTKEIVECKDELTSIKNAATQNIEANLRNFRFFEVQSVLLSVKEMRDFHWQKKQIKVEEPILKYFLNTIINNNNKLSDLSENMEIADFKAYIIIYFQLVKSLIFKYESFFDNNPKVDSELKEMKFFLTNSLISFCEECEKEYLKQQISSLGNYLKRLNILFKNELDALNKSKL